MMGQRGLYLEMSRAEVPVVVSVMISAACVGGMRSGWTGLGEWRGDHELARDGRSGSDVAVRWLLDGSC